MNKVNIDKFAPRSGRIIRENGTIVNEADLLEQIANNTSGGGGGGGGTVEVIQSLSSKVYSFQFWGSEVNNSASNPGLDVSNYAFRKVIIKNSTDAALIQIRIYAFLRDSSGSELHRETLDLDNLAAGGTLAIDATNFPSIDDAWTHLLVRTNATGGKTGNVQVIFVSRGHL